MNRRWFAGLLTLVLPVLLAAPPVWVLKRHAAELRSGEQLLRREILRLDRAIVEIQALDRTKASFLGRKSVVEVLDENRTHAVRLLNALGTLPPGLQLKTLVTRGDAVTLTGVAVVLLIAGLVPTLRRWRGGPPPTMPEKAPVAAGGVA